MAKTKQNKKHENEARTKRITKKQRKELKTTSTDIMDKTKTKTMTRDKSRAKKGDKDKRNKKQKNITININAKQNKMSRR